MFIATSLSFYKKREVQQALVEQGENKEVAIRFGQAMGKRPDILSYPNDVLELAKKGASSYHCSEELWTDPLQLKPGMKREELDKLRKGWDLIIDIDCKLFEYSKLATYYIVKVIKHYGIKSVTVKFSGNKGFHIGVPFEAFPDKIGDEPMAKLFPEAPQRIALLIKEKIKEPVKKALLKLENNNVDRIVEKIQDPQVIEYYSEKGMKVATINMEPFLAIDTILISSRHMYRMPYSLHEKSGLASVPFDVNNILQFSKEQARPENITFDVPFLDRKTVEKGEAATLLREAYDFSPTLKQDAKQEGEARVYVDDYVDKIPEQFFPPSIKNILEGLQDGRKRALFVLINFFSHMHWSKEDVEARLAEWNTKNAEPLKEVYLKGQLRYYSSKKDKLLPPSYENKAYYHDLGVYGGELENDNAKNPVSWVKRRLGLIKKEAKKEERAKVKAEKEEKNKAKKEAKKKIDSDSSSTITSD